MATHTMGAHAVVARKQERWEQLYRMATTAVEAETARIEEFIDDITVENVSERLKWKLMDIVESRAAICHYRRLLGLLKKPERMELMGHKDIAELQAKMEEQTEDAMDMGATTSCSTSIVHNAAHAAECAAWVKYIRAVRHILEEWDRED